MSKYNTPPSMKQLIIIFVVTILMEALAATIAYFLKLSFAGIIAGAAFYIAVYVMVRS